MSVILFSGFEVVLWSVLAIVVAVRFRKSDSQLRRAARLAALFFVLFAISDAIEMQTGAWWRPPRLLVLKAVCLIGLTLCFVMLIRGVRAVAKANELPGKPVENDPVSDERKDR
jgi:hypothetical protein